MKLAIMQPYFFPYLGYWQLINAVDRFLVYDDVNYIKQGWVNRNRILINGDVSYITVPLLHASPNKKICDIEISNPDYSKRKLLKTIVNSYRRSPFFDEIYPVMESAITSPEHKISVYLWSGIRAICRLLGIQTKLLLSSECCANAGLKGQDRIIDICRKEGVDMYINAEGGRALYNAKAFSDAGVDIRFLVMRQVAYKQKAERFVPGLSIIDVLMENGVAGTVSMLGEFDLIPE